MSAVTEEPNTLHRGAVPPLNTNLNLDSLSMNCLTNHLTAPVLLRMAQLDMNMISGSAPQVCGTGMDIPDSLIQQRLMQSAGELLQQRSNGGNWLGNLGGMSLLSRGLGSSPAATEPSSTSQTTEEGDASSDESSHSKKRSLDCPDSPSSEAGDPTYKKKVKREAKGSQGDSQEADNVPIDSNRIDDFLKILSNLEDDPETAESARSTPPSPEIKPKRRQRQRRAAVPPSNKSTSSQGGQAPESSKEAPEVKREEVDEEEEPVAQLAKPDGSTVDFREIISVLSYLL